MYLEPVTLDDFQAWKQDPVTKRLMAAIRADREQMKEGLVNNAFDNEEGVKGRCQVIAVILDIEYEDLFQQKYEERDVE